MNGQVDPGRLGRGAQGAHEVMGCRLLVVGLSVGEGAAWNVQNIMGACIADGSARSLRLMG